MPAVKPTGAIVLLTRLARAAHRRADEDLLGMKLKEFTALSALRDTDGRGQRPRGAPAAAGAREVGGPLLMDANNLVLLLNVLEERGHVTRQRDPGDRRRHVVGITDAGRAALANAEEAIEEADEEVLGRLSSRERADLRRLLAKALGEGAQR